MNLPKLILILSFIVSCGYEKHDKVTDLANGALAADGNDESKRKVGFCLAIHEIVRFHGRKGYNEAQISV